MPYQQITNNLGQSGILGGAFVYTVVDGTNNYSLNDTFSVGADPVANGWQICAWGTDSIFQYPSNNAVFTWNTPSSMWQPQVSTNVVGPYATIAVGSVLNDGVRTAFVTNSQMSSGKTGFYRLKYVPAP